MNEPHVTLERARLTADPETKQSKSGRPYMVINLAVNPSHKDKTGQYVDDPTTFFRLTVFDTRLMETYRQQLRKGTMVRADGNLKAVAYMSNDGQPRVGLELDYPRLSIPLMKAPKPQQADGHIQRDSYPQADPYRSDPDEPVF